jgi:SAM-dependent methyltransferase
LSIFLAFVTTADYTIGELRNRGIAELAIPQFKIQQFSILMAFFRKSGPGDPLAVTMTGVKLGDRLLAVGVSDTALVAALAIKSGLTGRACAVDADEARVKAGGAAIEREGALVEVTRAPWGMLPYDEASFDVAVVRDVFATLPSQARALAASAIYRVLRPGGRVVVIEPAPRGGVIGALMNRQQRDPEYVSSGGAVAALTHAGFAAVRQLAEHEGQVFVEGIKKN